MTGAPSHRSDADFDAAARWYARLSSDAKTPEDESAFERWLDSAPENAEAYAEIAALSERVGALAGHPDMAALRAEAQLLEEREKRPLFLRVGGAKAIGGLVAAIAAVMLLFVFVNAASVETGAWTTARGETMEITLADGTDVVLGSDSRLEIRFLRRHRDVRLHRGQAFFDVAHDARRPFVVAANERTVTALGTAFDVRSYTNETTVTLVRGAVAIAREGERNETLLSPGQQFQVAFGVSSVRDVDATAETAWRTGILEFDNVTLTEAVTEFNRSAPHSIIVSDPRLADLRVSGVFRANDPAGFTAALAPAYGITAAQQSSGDIVLGY